MACAGNPLIAVCCLLREEHWSRGPRTDMVPSVGDGSHYLTAK